MVDKTVKYAAITPTAIKTIPPTHSKRRVKKGLLHRGFQQSLNFIRPNQQSDHHEMFT